MLLKVWGGKGLGFESEVLEGRREGGGRFKALDDLYLKLCPNQPDYSTIMQVECQS